MHIIFDTPHQIEIYSVSHHIYSLVITFFFYFVYEHSWPIFQKTLLFLGTLFYGYDRCRLKVHENVWIKFPSIYIGGWKVCIYLPWSFHYVICKTNTDTPTHIFMFTWWIFVWKFILHIISGIVLMNRLTKD